MPEPLLRRRARVALRENLRALALLAAMPFKVDAARTVAGLGLLILSQLAMIVAPFGIKLAVDAATSGHHPQAVAAVVVLVASTTLTLAGSWAAFAVRMRMNELTTLAVDTELGRLTSAVVGIEHYERPVYLDRMQVLREEHQNLAGVPDAAAWTSAIALRLLVTGAVLAGLDARLLLLPLFAIPSLVANWRAQRRYLATWDAVMPTWRMQGALLRLVGSEPTAREARAFGLQPELADRFDEALQDADGPLASAMLRGNIEQTLGWAVFGFAFAGSLVMVADSLLQRRATPGDLVLVLTLGVQLNGQLTLFVGMLTQLLRGLRTASRLLWLRDHAVAAAAEEPSRPVPAPDRVADGITFERVSFRYPGTDVDVLRDVDVHLPAGATVAIVGDNGAGKTTLVKLLTRMYRPTSGRISIDGIDLADLDAGEWRMRTSAGFQDFARFELTAQETVGVGHLPDVHDTDVTAAALERAHGLDVVDDLPDGLATQLGRQFDDGHELSGGQWQKLAIGRAMMRRAPLLLVLDEPTAALDALTEASLFERYAGAARRTASGTGGITILVSHRFSTVRMAD
ncbi:MAG: ATP-binding cassette, subfamily bacterial, partial [Actinomycetota bacterium]